MGVKVVERYMEAVGTGDNEREVPAYKLLLPWETKASGHRIPVDKIIRDEKGSQASVNDDSDDEGLRASDDEGEGDAEENMAATVKNAALPPGQVRADKLAWDTVLAMPPTYGISTSKSSARLCPGFFSPLPARLLRS